MRNLNKFVLSVSCFLALGLRPGEAKADLAGYYLSDLNPYYATNSWGEYERDRSNGEAGSGDGNYMYLGGSYFSKGLGVHANAELKYNLEGRCTRFRSYVGLDDEVGYSGSVQFQIWADGTFLYDSGEVYGYSDPQYVDVDVSGHWDLTLLAYGGESLDYDHADFGGALVDCYSQPGSGYEEPQPEIPSENYSCPNGYVEDGSVVTGYPDQVICGGDKRNWKCTSAGWDGPGSRCSPAYVPEPVEGPMPPMDGQVGDCPWPLQNCVDTSMPYQFGSTIWVPSEGDLQAALIQAQPGDTIVLQSGGYYYGDFILPRKEGYGWIVITGNGYLPGEGTRVTPGDAWSMPKIISSSPSNGSAFRTEPGSHHFRLVGLEITAWNTASENSNLLLFGHPEHIRGYGDMPHHIVVDRCYVYQSGTSVKNGIAINGSSIAVINSHVSGFHQHGTQTQAVGGWTGVGPFKIQNNYLEAAGENFIYGGSDTSFRGLVPYDLDFRGNLVSKQLWWKYDPGFKGDICNIFEIKNMSRAHIDGNIFENNWESCQSGAGVLFTPRNQDGSAPQSIVEWVMFSNNVLRNSGSGLNILGISRERPDGTPDLRFSSQQANHIWVLNNLLYNIDRTWGDGYGFMINESDSVTIGRNTIVQTGNTAAIYGAPSTNFAMYDNIFREGSYGFHGGGAGMGDAAWATYFQSSWASGNVMVGFDYPSSYTTYFWDSSFVGSDYEVGFNDYYGGNFSLADWSPYHGKGVDCAGLNAAIRKFGEWSYTGCGW